MIVALVLVGVLVLVVLWGVVAYNGLVSQRNKVEESWAQIDTELKRRHDLIGNLVETVKGYAAHERGTLEDVIQARSNAMAPGQSPAAQAQSEGLLSQALGRLFALAESYPDLKANQNFLSLQSELTNTEDRIASARRYYNAVVRDYNTKIQTVPTNLIANLFSFTKREYFEIEGQERDPIKVDFGTGGPSAAAPAAPSIPPSSAAPSIPPPPAAPPTATPPGPPTAPPASPPPAG